MKRFLFAIALMSATSAYAGTQRFTQPALVDFRDHDVIVCKTTFGIKCISPGFGAEITPEQFAKRAGYTHIIRRTVLVADGDEYIVMEVE